MSLRQPTSTLDRLSSLTIGDSERKSSTTQQREPPTDIANENTGPGLVQRCVVVQKDQLGFGFTVCGERVKLVQNVRPGGAAVKAGVQEGDRIIKVNGLLVSSMSHQEVVKLIKSGTYVALTLQGPPPLAASLPLEPLPTELTANQRSSLAGETPPPPPPPLPSGLSSNPSQRITGPRPLQDPEVQKHATQILRKMLEQEEAELQDLMEEHLRNPSPSLEERIESAKRRAHQVRIKILQDVVRRFCFLLFLLHPETNKKKLKSPHSSPSSSFRNPLHRRQSSDTHNLSDLSGKAQIIAPEELDEDDGYAFNEMDGPFQDIELLKSRPAHMTVFMRYIFSQLLDPNPLLFYLSVEAYLGFSPKDARTLAPQICSHFLDPDTPLKIKVKEDDLTDIKSRLHAQEDIRGPLSELQQQVLPEIQDQIQDYRSKQMMGLGSLFGEGDLQTLDGDPVKEKQVVDKQVTALWEILSKHEEERSSPLAWAVLLYLRHSGIKLRDSKVFPGQSTEKEKWLLFLKAKKLSGTKKEKEKDGEDKKRNPILKYIGKPRSTSHVGNYTYCLSSVSVRHGNVRNIIQQFESNTESTGEEGGEATDTQRLSTSSSLGEDTTDSPTVLVRLGRSESLKAQGEGRRRGTGAAVNESVPRSRSDVDMEDCGEDREGSGLRPLQHSASSSASSSSARSLENPTPPYTPRSGRRSVDSPLALLPDAAVVEEEACEGQNWQDTVSPQLLSTLSHREVDRQAVIYELFTTEVSHLRTLRVLDQVFFQKMRSVLNSDELACIFPNLPQVYGLHASLCEAMKEQRETPVVQEIGDVMLARFDGAAGEEFQEQVSQLCSLQSQARELIKNKKRKDPRFAQIIQECEASPHCRRLQLKDLLVSEMQRLTKYPLLLDNIIKYTEAGSSDLPALQRALACCRGILRVVNELVGETEHQQRLSQYQRRLDAAPHNLGIFSVFQSLDLNTKRLIHEGTLIWKLSKEKRIEIQGLLLSDCLVLLQKGPDDRLQLRYPSRWLSGAAGGGGDSKTSFSPVVKLDSLLVRSVATNKKALYIISTTESQIYELVAASESEKNMWKDLLEKTVSTADGSSPMINHGSIALSMTEQSDSMEPNSSNDNNIGLSDITSMDQSEAIIGVEQPGVGVAEAALQDVESLRQLILRDLEEDGWSHDSDDTPTNETANDGSSVCDRQRPTSLETVLSFSTNEWEAEPEEAEPSDPEQPSVHVVRKGNVDEIVAVIKRETPSFITDDVTFPTGQSSEPKGNTFYLVMPTEQGESITDDFNDPPTPTASHFPELSEEVLSPQIQPQEDDPPTYGHGKSHRFVIRNVDEIFHTIEGLTSKLRQLKEIEKAHYKLLKTLTVEQESGEQQCLSANVTRTPSMDRGLGSGEWTLRLYFWLTADVHKNKNYCYCYYY
uniref:Rho guanine nucleotide exchange factor 11 n=1 Tax=Cynoglossus semilaevis TaxID=244447 RepID=A0A3P8UCX9_CYNSE